MVISSGTKDSIFLEQLSGRLNGIFSQSPLRDRCQDRNVQKIYPEGEYYLKCKGFFGHDKKN